MESTLTAIEKPKKISPGTIRLGEARLSGDAPSTYKQIFRCKKNNFEYLGQVRVEVTPPSIQVELFNNNFFDQFEMDAELVQGALEDRLLFDILKQENISLPHREVIDGYLKDRKQYIESESVIEELPVDKRDLEFLKQRLNQEYFKGKLEVNIEWGKKVNTTNRRSIRFGSFEEKKNLIRIHPRLKQEFVPLEVLELTIYHEMCHKFLPPVKRNGKWEAHHKDFKKKEREFSHYRQAVQWEKRNWAKLLTPMQEQEN